MLNLLHFFTFFFQFLVRQQVLSLYRDIQRALRKVENPKDRQELQQWARGEFERNKHQTDEVKEAQTFLGWKNVMSRLLFG